MGGGGCEEARGDAGVCRTNSATAVLFPQWTQSEAKKCFLSALAESRRKQETEIQQKLTASNNERHSRHLFVVLRQAQVVKSSPVHKIFVPYFFPKKFRLLSDPIGLSNTVKLHIFDGAFIVSRQRHTSAIIILSDQHLDT